MDHSEDYLQENVVFEVDWAKESAMKANTYLIITWYLKSRTSDHRPAQKIYNVVAKIKKNRMLGRNMVEEVLCLSTQRGYTVICRNSEDNNVLSDIVVPHPTLIEMIRT
ncbi:hypothetical protein M9H77_14327 [Catharanthus roseus]|uniref:Uncharacterized protein n=1 Tax=Catharanthus roseus TaxID=4058 RepID=A0ACC0BMY9_CATRO|nr:hypothetical protein M9H77_14327 [Catharanthus roseus]